jgi:hypothetical protein
MNTFTWTVGTKYKTRGGSWAKVVAVVPEALPDQQLVIFDSRHKTIGYRYINGYNLLNDQYSGDLLPEEWVEPGLVPRKYRLELPGGTVVESDAPIQLESPLKIKRYRYRVKDSEGDIWDSMNWYISEQECLEDNYAETRILKQIDEDEFDT